MVHPFLWVSESSRTRVFWVFFTLAVALMVILQLLGAPLRTAAAPAGIVSYELAGQAAESQKILSAWDAVEKAFAGLNLGLDYLFIVSYVGAIGLGCSLLAVKLVQRFRALAYIGVTLAWAQFLAAAFDSLENIALLKLLFGSEQPAWSVVARACAIPKFLIVLLGLLYILVALVFAFAGAGRGARSATRQ
jgi:hypothetical protein